MTILRAGMQTTVQDLGRTGYRGIGVPHSGAMDPVALRLANSLVGNAENAAALEFTLVGPALEFSADALIAVCGAECEGVSSWQPLHMTAGTKLDLGACVRGCRGYVSVAGGIDVPLVLGSRSTYLRGGWGGFEGRALHDRDRLPVGVNEATRDLSEIFRSSWRIDPRILPAYGSTVVIRAMRPSNASEWADPLFSSEFKVTPKFDRMGITLSGPRLVPPAAENMISTAVGPGTVQVPPNGQPVVLMADAQTIGGYPHGAHVICVDRPLLAQLRPGDTLRFQEVTIDEAHQLALSRDHAMAILREGLIEKIRGKRNGAS
ncbi:MAG: biotin-dependent carboxyltransferase family protein [Opitutus sp.]